MAIAAPRARIPLAGMFILNKSRKIAPDRRRCSRAAQAGSAQTEHRRVPPAARAWVRGAGNARWHLSLPGRDSARVPYHRGVNHSIRAAEGGSRERYELLRVRWAFLGSRLERATRGRRGAWDGISVSP